MVTVAVDERALTTLENVDDADFLAKGIASGLGTSGLAEADLTNIANADFLAKGAASGLAKIDLTNVPSATLLATGASAGLKMDVVLATDIATTTIPTNVKEIVTSGYAAKGVGGGRYVVTATTGATAYRFQSANGRWFQYKPYSLGADLQAFGAVPDGAVGASRSLSGTDNAAAIRAWLYFSIYVEKCAAIAPAGCYLTTEPLHAGYGDGAYDSAHIFGAGPKFRGESAFAGTAFLCDYSNAGGIHFQGIRQGDISGCTFVGKNFDWIESHALGTNDTTLDDTDIANWKDTGLHANAESRYAPNAGVVIDGYSGTQPATHYPDVTYPSEMGSPTQYGKNFSTLISVTNCSFHGFVGGVAIQPCDADGNGDRIHLNQTTIEYVSWLFSAGNDQGRTFGGRDNYFSNFHTGFLNAQHGRQAGRFGGTFVNTGFDRLIQMFNIGNAGIVGAMTFDGCSGENIWKLGKWGTTANANFPLVFINPNFNFTLQTDARGVPPRLMEGSTPCPVIIRGGKFEGFPSCFLLAGQTGDFEIEGLGLRHASDARATAAEKLFHSGSAGGIFFQPGSAKFRRPARFSVQLNNRYNIDTATTTSEKIGDTVYSSRSYPINPWSKRAQPINEVGYEPACPSLWDNIAKSSLSSCSKTGKELTIVFSSRSDATYMQFGPLPGDTIMDDDDDTIYMVHSRVGTTVIATAQTNYKSDGLGSYTALNAFHSTTGNLYFINNRVYTTQYYNQGTLSTASAIITAAGRDDGFASFLTTEILVNDAMYANSDINRQIVIANALVTAVDGAAKTITLTGNLNKTASNVAIPWWIRQAPANT